jgi:hypothetical protein
MYADQYVNQIPFLIAGFCDLRVKTKGQLVKGIHYEMGI